jgi:fido (protein-threonine AMPylation protein)
MMRLADYTKHLIDLGQTIYQWVGQVAEIDRARREKVALYAEEIAATLSRAASALAANNRLCGNNHDCASTSP